MRFYVRGLSIWILVSKQGWGGVLEALCHVSAQGCLEQQTLEAFIVCQVLF